MTNRKLRRILSDHTKWLAGEGGKRANLRGADLRGFCLAGVNLSKADMSGANLSGVDMRGVNLAGADLHDANLAGADLGPLARRTLPVSAISP